MAKELRLQIPTVVVAGLFGLLWSVTLVVPGRPVQLFWVYQTVFGLLITLLAGAVASAEERQFGTVDAQLLQPIAAWRQWALKVAVVTGVVAVLCVGLNVLLSLLSPADVRESLRTWQSGERGEMIAGVAGLALVAVYASSVTRGGLRALVMGGAGALAMIALVSGGFTTLLTLGFEVGIVSGFGLRHAGQRELLTVVQFALAVVTGLMALRYAYFNHRFADVRPTRILQQISTMYVWLVGTMFAAHVLVVRVWR